MTGCSDQTFYPAHAYHAHQGSSREHSELVVGGDKCRVLLYLIDGEVSRAACDLIDADSQPVVMYRPPT